jgi:hypothetical protein
MVCARSDQACVSGQILAQLFTACDKAFSRVSVTLEAVPGPPIFPVSEVPESH